MNNALNVDGVLNLLALGGPTVAVLGAMSVFGLAIVLLKSWQFAAVRIGQRDFIDKALAHWRDGDAAAARAALENERNPIADVLTSALAGLQGGVDPALVREEAARRGARALAELRGYFRPLEVIGSLAPLLGLLGTVMGMIEAFRELQNAGSQVNPAVLSGGIWEALLTTAVGLIVAIPAVAALNWLERRVERLHEDMQDALTRVFTQPAQTAQPAQRPAARAGQETPTSGHTAHAH